MAIDESKISADKQELKTLPYRLYVDPEVLKLENEKIFKRAWNFVGHVSRIPNAGDYFTYEIAGEPILVLRDHDNEVRAFYNVCPHRGTKLMKDENGSKKILQCCYHGWTFKLNGQLHQAPNFKNVECFCTADYGLRPVRVEVESSLIFVNLDDNAAPVREVYKDFLDDISQFSFLMDVKPHSVKERVLKCNWKVFIDNYLECDHCPIAHPGFVSTLDMTKYQIVNANNCNIQGSSIKQSRQDYNDAEVQEGRFYWLWPNVMFTIYPGPGNFRVIQMFPVDSETTRGVYTIYLTGDEFTEEQKALMEFTEQVAAEDVELIELQQLGLKSSAFTEGICSPTEHGVFHFRELVLEALEL